MRVQEYGSPHRFHVATHATAVVDKDLGHPIDVSRAGVAGHQTLDQLLGNERGCVGVHEQSVQCDAEALCAECACRNDCAEEAFRFRAVQTRVQSHRQTLAVSRCGQGAGGVGAGRQVPTGEDFGQTLNVIVVVGLYGLALCVQLQAAVGVEFVQTNGEQLQHFAGIVFIRRTAGGGIGFLVALHVEVGSHGRA